MLGAIIGDIVGSRFEWNNIKTKNFEFFTDKCFTTDDSMMTLAIAEALLDTKNDRSHLSDVAVKRMQEWGRLYPNKGYGGHFFCWLFDDEPRPYKSFGNGAAMRVSACGFAAESLEEAKKLSFAVTQVTHNHQQGLKGADAIAVAIFMARKGSSKEEIRKFITDHYYNIDFTLDEIRPGYEYDITCQGTVPQALEAFFESESFEDAIRNAISIGGDPDTMGAITGGVAEAYYGIPEDIRKKTMNFFLDEKQREIVERFEAQYNPKKKYDLYDAHDRSANNKKALQNDKICGCFCCLEIFNPSEIKEYVIANTPIDYIGTALCPYCGIDAVLGESSEYPITKTFLAAMGKAFFASEWGMRGVTDWNALRAVEVEVEKTT